MQLPASREGLQFQRAVTRCRTGGLHIEALPEEPYLKRKGESKALML